MSSGVSPVAGIEPARALELAIEKEGSAKNFAFRVGLSEAYVSDVRLGRRPFGPAILLALGLVRVVTFAPATSQEAR